MVGLCKRWKAIRSTLASARGLEIVAHATRSATYGKSDEVLRAAQANMIASMNPPAVRKLDCRLGRAKKSIVLQEAAHGSSVPRRVL